MRGGCDRSYGIQVARLAGLPQEVIDRAKTVLANLETEDVTPAGTPGHTRTRPAEDAYQLSLFVPQDNPALEELKQINLNTMTPLEALNALHMLQQKAISGDG